MASPFNVGGTPLDRSRFNPQSFAKLADLASGVPIKENKSKDEWREIADRIAKNDEVSQDDFNAFKELSKAAGPERSRLRKELAASGYKDEKVRAELANFYVFDYPFNKLTDAMRLSQGRVAVEALAGASFGPLNLVSAFHAYANLQKNQLESLVEGIQARQNGTATNVLPGNKVQQFHHEKIWQKMMNMLDGARESAKAGKPTEINAQYYELTSPEMMAQLASNAEAGNKVRVNVDAGRLVAFRGSEVTLEELPDKLRCILQLTQLKGDVGVSTYPVTKLLGDPNDLMHRKGLRVGDEFLLSGMNANAGSGENIDAGYLIEGPAARKLVQNFARDVKDSSKVSNEDVFGPAVNEFEKKDVRLRTRALVALIDGLSGPSPAGTALPKPQSFTELKEYADSKGFDLGKLIDVPAGELEQAVNGMIHDDQAVPASKLAKEKVVELIDKAMDATRTPKNLKALDDITAPKGSSQGNTVVGIADLPTERETEMLMAIQNAEKFVYVPAFVMTRPVAAALVAKNNEMKAQGKPFDVRVIADPGIYPDGGTPSEAGIRTLEDGGIRARWALLPRCGWHDRKVHAKELLTDKCEFFGSTNFSNKGLHENWEHSGVVQFDESDPASIEQREQSKAYFEDMWDHFSYECNTIDLATLWKKNYDGPDKEYQIEDARYGVFRKILKGVEEWEKDAGKWMGEQTRSPQVQARVAELTQSGVDEMSAEHLAVREVLGDDKYFAGLHGLQSYRDLQRLAPRRSAHEE